MFIANSWIIYSTKIEHEISLILLLSNVNFYFGVSFGFILSVFTKLNQKKEQFITYSCFDK